MKAPVFSRLITAKSPYLYAYADISRARAHHQGWQHSKSEFVIIELRAEPEDIIFEPHVPRLKKAVVVAHHPVKAEKEAA